jgi:hypothetical protein
LDARLIAFQFIFAGGHSDAQIPIFVSHYILLLIPLNALASNRAIYFFYE